MITVKQQIVPDTNVVMFELLEQLLMYTVGNEDGDMFALSEKGLQDLWLKLAYLRARHEKEKIRPGDCQCENEMHTFGYQCPIDFSKEDKVIEKFEKSR